MRGIAILMVCVFHFAFGMSFLGGARADQLIYCGLYGVDLFFVLSGFLITGILLDSRTSRNYFSTFYARRSLRIFPLYYAFLGTYSIAMAAFHQVRAQGEWWYWIYLSNWKPNHTRGDAFLSQLWSLSVEEQFYLVWAAAVWFLGPKWLPAFCIALTILALGIRVFLSYSGVDDDTIYRGTVTRLDALALGSLMAAVARNEGWARRLRSVSTDFMMICAALTLLAVAIDRSTAYRANVLSWGSCAMAALFAILVFRASSGYHSWLSWKPLTGVGQRAYGIYLIHAPMSEFFRPRFLKLNPGAVSIVAYTIAMFCAAYALAWLSFRFFEAPINRFKRHFRYRGKKISGET